MARLRNITILSYPIYICILWATSGEGKVNTIPYEFLFHSFLFLFFLKNILYKITYLLYFWCIVFCKHSWLTNTKIARHKYYILYLMFKRQTDSQQICSHQSNILLTLRSYVVVVTNIFFFRVIDFIRHVPTYMLLIRLYTTLCVYKWILQQTATVGVLRLANVIKPT